MPAPREAVDRRRSVVYLETVPQPAFEAPSPRARRARPAQRDLRAARGGGHRGQQRRLPEQRHGLPQRVLALEDAPLRPRPLPARPVALRRLRPHRRRPRVLRDPLAHERLHPGLRAPLLRGHRRRRALPHRRRPARQLHARALERGQRPAPPRAARGRRARCSSRTWRWSDGAPARLAALPRVRRDRGGGGAAGGGGALLRDAARGAAGRGRARARARAGGAPGRAAPQLADRDGDRAGAADRRPAQAQGRGRHRRPADGGAGRDRLPPARALGRVRGRRPRRARARRRSGPKEWSLAPGGPFGVERGRLLETASVPIELGERTPELLGRADARLRARRGVRRALARADRQPRRDRAGRTRLRVDAALGRARRGTRGPRRAGPQPAARGRGLRPRARGARLRPARARTRSCCARAPRRSGRCARCATPSWWRRSPRWR